jgi:hypothetical protein
VRAPEQILREATSVLLVDWPAREVPAALRAAGLEVTVKSGPGPDDFNPGRPDAVDLVYAYRPIEELAGIAELAHALGARTLWHGVELGEAEIAQARSAVEAEGLAYVHGEDIVAAARSR